jgi:glucuronokinase
VVQAYEGLVYMDFSREHERIVHGLPCFRYEPLDPAMLPPVFLAHHHGLSEPTEIFHNNIRERFRQGDQEVVAGIARVADLAATARSAVMERDAGRLASAIDANFDVRRRIFNLPPWQVQMIDVVRGCGASANFAGSGGAIVATYGSSKTFAALEAIDCRVITPQIAAEATE